MSNSKVAVTADSLRGMTVLSVASGNKVGLVDDLFLYPDNGSLSGISLTADGHLKFVPYDDIHSLGSDAIMVEYEQSAAPVEAAEETGRSIKAVFGARVISDSGDILGQITQVYVTLMHPPAVIFQISKSLLHRFFGLVSYLPASAGHVLSDDSRRLVVPRTAAKAAVRDIRDLIEQGIIVRSFEGVAEMPHAAVQDDDDDDVTVVRNTLDEDETVVRLRDEDETVVRMPRKAG